MIHNAQVTEYVTKKLLSTISENSRYQINLLFSFFKTNHCTVDQNMKNLLDLSRLKRKYNLGKMEFSFKDQKQKCLPLNLCNTRYKPQLHFFPWHLGDTIYDKPIHNTLNLRIHACLVFCDEECLPVQALKEAFTLRSTSFEDGPLATFYFVQLQCLSHSSSIKCTREILLI